MDFVPFCNDFSVKIWKPHRKILNTTFNMKILQSFVPIFCEKVKYLVRNLGDKVDSDYFDITSMVHTCALEMVCGKLIESIDLDVI